MSDKVITMIYGRLGNILFEIGAGLSYAKRTNKEFHVVNKDYKLTPFNNYPCFYSKYKEKTPDMFRRELYCVWTCDHNKRAVTIPYLNGNVILDGYFQSEKYLDVDFVRNEFRIDDGERKRFIKKYDGLCDGVGISVRRGDYLGLRNIFNVLSSSYYKDIYSKYFKGLKCFVTSDDIQWCKENLKIRNMEFIYENDEDTLRVLSLCHHHILSCSTFSWWGAWLEEQKDSINIVPSKWFAGGANLCGDDVIPDRWVKINLEEKYLEI